jgi:hypothetical protein
MSDTYSNTIGVEFMGTGLHNNTWGTIANSSVFQIFEDAIANVLTETVTGDSPGGGILDLSGSPPPAAASQVRHSAIVFNGTLQSNQIVKVPNLSKFWWISNQTSGAFTLTIKTPSGSASTAIPQNSGWQLVQCDGANNITVSPFNSIQAQMPDGSVTAPPYSNINETNSGWYRAGTQDWRLSINGIDALKVTGAGASSPSSLSFLGANLAPPGMVVAYDGILAPTGWIMLYGQALSRPVANGGSVDTYKGIFNAITATFVGNSNGNTLITGITTDMRGKGLNKAFIEGTGVSLGTTITFTGASTATVSSGITGSSTLTFRVLPFGQGDGSTTFNVRDGRGTTLFGRDDMNGTARSLITVAGGNFDGTLLGINRAAADIAGGAQNKVIANSNLPADIPVSDSGHTHNFNEDSNGNGGSGGGILIVQRVGSGASGGPVVTASATTGIKVNDGAANTALPLMNPAGISNLIMKL